MSRPATIQPSFALEAVRAGAAFAVLLSHARDMLVRDAAATPAMGMPARAVMAASGLGHQAVIVFFVLSGFLVTGSMRRLAAQGRWSLPAFAAARLTRLWIVLVPCLVLGGGLDAVGLSSGAMVSGLPYGIPPLSGPGPAPSLAPAVALGNLVFLQTIAVPVFGSNGALWSLANEAWYYALAGLVFAAWQGRRTPTAAIAPAVAALAVAVMLPGAVLQLAPVWGFGAAGALLRPAPPSSDGRRLIPALLAFGAVLAASRLRLGGNLLLLDLLLGAATALLIRRLAALPKPASGRAGAAVCSVSRLSYSLYLSHCPVLALFAAITLGGRRLPLGPGACALMVAAMMAALVTAWGVWWGFERHTDRLRAALGRARAIRPGARALAGFGSVS